MIIKPRSKIELDKDSIAEFGEDEFGSYIQKQKTVISKDNKTFIRTLIKDRSDKVYKESLIGEINGNVCNVRSSSSAIIDKKGSGILNYNLSVPDPISNKSYNIGDKNTITLNRFNIDKNNVYNTTNELSINDSIDYLINEVEYLENEYQLEYNRFVGLIKTFFNSCLWSFPLDSFISIDCVHGTYNINSFKIINLDKEIMEKQYKGLLQSISDLALLLKRICELNKRKLIVYVFLGNAEYVIRIIDIDRNTKETFYSTNNDLANALIKNSISDGICFTSTEEYDFLNNNKYINYNCEKKVIDEIMGSVYLDTLEYCNKKIKYYL